MKLGKRLAAIAALVPRGCRIADIGTDHAYLPVQLVAGGIVQSAVASEVHNGPYAAAMATIAHFGLAERIELRLGDGLAVLRPGEVDAVIIAGMGGTTIIAILTAHPEIVGTLSRLILQPMQAAGMMRCWLADHGWRLVEEELVEEDGRIYELVAAEWNGVATAEVADPLWYEIGPLLWAKRHPLLKSHLQDLIAQRRRIVAAMAASSTAAASPKYREYCRTIAELEERYACL